jgi:ribosomal protein S18 acetylase RimI-like enzyme
MSAKQLPHKWETRQLTAEDSTLHEVQELQEINDAIPSIRGWMGVTVEGESEDPMRFALTEGILPPTGSKGLFRLQSIRLRRTGQLIGFLGVYQGFPSDDTFWVTAVAFHPDFQAQGYGKELMRGLSDTVRQLGTFSCMQACVSLKNWPSLRFCVQTGFDRVVKIVGDKVLSDEAHAHITLEKPFALEDFSVRKDRHQGDWQA